MQAWVREILSELEITNIAWNEQDAQTFHAGGTYPSALFVVEGSTINAEKARLVVVQDADGGQNRRRIRGTQLIHGRLSLYVATQQSSVDLTASIVDASPWRRTQSTVQVDSERDTTFLRDADYYTATLPIIFERDRYQDLEITLAGAVTEDPLQVSESEEEMNG